MPPPQQPGLDRLLSTLQQSGLSQDNPPLYQVISQLIRATKAIQTILNSNISGTVTDITTLAALVALLQALSYITVNDDSALLPNSRRLLAGSNVSFDDSVASVRTINVSSSILDHVVMSDGATPIPSPMNDGFGNFIYIAYTP